MSLIVPEPERQLEEQLTAERTEEMRKYGRPEIFSEMLRLLLDKHGRVLYLVNHGLAMVDDELDSSADPLRRLRDFQEIFQKSYLAGDVEASTQTEQAVIDLGYLLNELSSAPFLYVTDHVIGRHTYEEVLNFWKIEERNFERRWKVLDKEELDEINSDIGASVASQFLHILDSPWVYNEFTQLARVYGRAVKLADDLCDFREDVLKGYINIPQESIHHVTGLSIEDGEIVLDSKRLSLSMEYIKDQYIRIEQAFESADRLMLVARARRPIWNSKVDERLYLFQQFCHSWFDQASEFVAVETSRRGEYMPHPENKN